MQNITKEQFSEWKMNPVTIEILQRLEEVRIDMLEQIGLGSTIDASADVTHGKTNRMIGHIEGLNQLLNISFSDSTEENDVDETSGY